MKFSYAKALREDIERWQAEGLIAPEQSAALIADVERRKRAEISLGQVVGILAAVLIAAAILLMVASNWEAIPRLTRVLLLGALIALSYLGGAVARSRGYLGRSEALYLIGAATYGGSLALIGQMYHLAGTESDALVAWGAGVALSATVLRSRSLTSAAAVIALVWLGVVGSSDPVSWRFPAAMLLLWPLSLWTHSSETRGLIVIGLLAWTGLLQLHEESAVVPVVTSLIGLALFSLAVSMPTQTERWLGSPYAGAVYGALAFFFGSAMLQIMTISSGMRIVVAAITLAAAVAGLLFAGRESRRVRRICYAGFTAQLLYLYFNLLGSMIGSAAFFLASGFVLAGLAWLISRFEKRFAGAPA